MTQPDDATLTRLLQEAGVGWLLQPEDPARTLQRVRTEISDLQAWLADAGRPAADLPCLIADNAEHYKPLIQSFASPVTTPARGAIFLLLQGLTLREAALSYAERDHVTLDLVLCDEQGSEVRAHSTELWDVELLAHVGLMKIGDEPVIHGYYAHATPASLAQPTESGADFGASGWVSRHAASDEELLDATERLAHGVIELVTGAESVTMSQQEGAVVGCLLALLNRSHQNCLAVCRLADAGLAIDAQVVLRGQLTSLVTSFWLLESPEADSRTQRARTLIEYSEAHRLRRSREWATLYPDQREAVARLEADLGEEIGTERLAELANWNSPFENRSLGEAAERLGLGTFYKLIGLKGEMAAEPGNVRPYVEFSDDGCFRLFPQYDLTSIGRSLRAANLMLAAQIRQLADIWGIELVPLEAHMVQPPRANGGPEA